MAKNLGKSVFGRLNVKKAQKKYKDVLTGYWEDAGDDGGTWNIDNRPEIQGYFVNDYLTERAYLYIDTNSNSEADVGDKYVGYARSAQIETGGYGRWNWSTGAGVGDFFTSKGKDAGMIFMEDTSFLG